MVKQSFPLLGLHCASCAAHSTKALQEVSGVQSASVNLATATAFVVFDETKTSLEALRDAITAVGYELRIDEPNPEELERLRMGQELALRRRALLAVLLSLFVMGLMMLGGAMTLPKALLSALAAGITLAVAGRDFFVRGWRQLQTRAAGMDLLVMLSTGTAYTFSLIQLGRYLLGAQDPHLLHHLYFEAASMTIAFVLLGKVLEARAERRTSTALRALLGSQPKTVQQLLPSGEVVTLPIADVEPGMLLRALPHELFAVDGEVIEGQSYADEQLISGEPFPVTKAAGDKVYAGTLNGSGSLVYRADEVGRATVLSRIIRLVQEAQASRAPIQQVVDKAARIFVPVVVALAFLTFLLWGFLASDGGWSQGLISGLTMLIIACPCALGLATPTAIMVGIGKGAQQGLLIRNAESLEAARQIDTLVLDKTGTITEGKPQVASIRWYHEKANHFAPILTALEERSSHPLAGAIVSYLGAAGSSEIEVSSLHEVAGQGLEAEVAGLRYRIGRSTFISELTPLTDEVQAGLEEGARLGATASLFASEEGVLALILITDSLRPSSKEAIAELQHKGIEVIMLTGDGPASAKAIAQAVGIPRVIDSVLPEGKVEAIRSLQAEGKQVAMVGDGINDAAALAQAQLSIAMGGGSDLAMETAMVTLRSGGIEGISRLFALSRRTLRTIHENLFWASIYNLIALPIAGGILYPFTGYLLDPMLAGALMMLSSLSVVGNSLWSAHKD